MQSLYAWLETTALAHVVGESLAATAWLSAAHMLGFTLAMSGALIGNLRAAGVVLTAVPLLSVARPATRLVAGGLTISVLTGFALFAPRASYTASIGAFQLKMTLLALAAAHQMVLMPKLLGDRPPGRRRLRASGAFGAVLWLSLAVAACWFVLFE